LNNLKFTVKYVQEHYNPTGHKDNGGRWYPDNDEKCMCCNNIRSPSRAYPWSLWKHCKSKKHVTNWVSKQILTNLVYKEAMAMTQETAALYVNTEDNLLAYVRDHVYGLHINSNPIKGVPCLIV
jgi:hypothetical protein